MDDNRSAGRRAKAYLGKIRQTDRTVQRLLELRFSLRASLYSTGAALSGMPGGGHDPDRTGRTIARLDELERRIDAYVDELVARKSEAFLRIRRLPELSSHGKCIMRNGRYTGYTGVHFSTLQTTWLKHNTQIGERGRFSCRSLLY